MPATSVAPPQTVPQWQYCLKFIQLAAHCLLCVAAGLAAPLLRHRMPGLSGWWYRRLLAILNVQIETQGVPPGHAVLAVANHVSWLDIAVFGSLLKPAFVSKAEVDRWPVLGAVARAAGTVFLPRGAFKTQEVSARLAATLARGRTVLLFPEATTSDQPLPRRFHARLFAAAIEHNYQVLPVAIRYLPEAQEHNGQHSWAPWIDDADLGRHLLKLLRLRRLRVRITFCPPIQPVDTNRNALAERSHAAITAVLQM